MDSETSLERGYADLVMIVRPDMRKYTLLDIIIEFKYISLSDLGLTGEQLRNMKTENLKALTPVKNKLAEAKIKLSNYSKILNTNYSDVLRLQSFVIISIGFDRLIWQQLHFGNIVRNN